MADHISTFDEDEDGWRIVTCSCGSTSPPLPDDETAADVWADHYAEAMTANLAAEVRALTARLDAAHTVIRRYESQWRNNGGEWQWHAADPTHDRYEPMASAEAAEIEATTADPTPHPDTPKWDPEVFPSETFPTAEPTPQTDDDT